MRPKGIKETKPRKRKTIVPGHAAFQRLWIGGHYKDRGLSFENFIYFSSLDCFYCGEPPKYNNPFGKTYEQYLLSNKKPCSKEWFDQQFISYNGVDKMVPGNDYHDLYNLVPCCKTCNWMKQLLGMEIFILQCNKIAERHPRLDTAPVVLTLISGGHASASTIYNNEDKTCSLHH
jgi:hypothetical protein